MEIGIDAMAIALMFCCAGVVFLQAILFKREVQRLRDKLEELKRARTIKYRSKCFSVEWGRNQSRLKTIVARSIYILVPIYVAGTTVIISLLLFRTIGYVMFVPLIGFPIFLDNALEMYKYSRAVRKVPLEILQKKDMEYMEEAIRVLTKKPKIYSIVGVIFSIVAPFIPLLFNLLPRFMATYFRPAFFLVEKFGIVPGIFVMLILFIALPTTLVIKHKWTIRQIKRPIEWIRSKRRRNES